MTSAPDGGVAIICGGGAFPLAAARAAREGGREILLIGLVGSAESAIETFPHVWVKLGELGKLFRTLEERGIRRLALIGNVVRPELTDLKLDFGAIRRLPDIARILRGGGDDHTLRKIAAFFEGQGYEVLAVHELAPELLAPHGPMTRLVPDTEALADIATGLDLLRGLSAFDAGQAVVVAQGRVLAMEAVEGTDAMLERVAALRASRRFRARGSAGVLIKAPKQGQDTRMDLPAMGPATIEKAAAAQLRGIAVAAGGVLMLDRADMAARADAAGMFLFGQDATA